MEQLSNPEIRLMFTRLEELLNSHTQVQSELREICLETRDQAKLTNGRVNALEKINENRAGAWSVGKWIAAFSLSILIGYLGWLGNEVNSIDKQLSAYEITVQ